MPEWLDSPQEWVAILTISVIVIGALTWLIRSQIAMSRNFQPNGGSSMRDQIDLIRDSQKETHKDIRELREQAGLHTDKLHVGLGKVHERLNEHISHHPKGTP